MTRDFQKLKKGPFDLLVIGGGVLGAWTAYDGALRGLSTAIIDKGDWAGGTSSASSKLIHGGIRYLEQFWLGLVYETLKERERLISLAPHRVFPLPFLIPLYQNGRLGRFSLKAGLTLYDLLAKLNSNTPFSGHRYLSRDEILAAAPCLRREGLTGGFFYTDARTDDARFTLEIVSGALSSGATAVNYAVADELLISGERVLGAVVKDIESGERVRVEAAVTVNAAGPWAFSIARRYKTPLPEYSLTKGVHLVMPAVTGKYALLLSAKSDNRIFFMLPWYGTTLLGTTDTEFSGEPDRATLTAADTDYLLEAGNSCLNSPGWNPGDIQGHFAGIRLLQRKAGRTPSRTTREWYMFEPMERFLMSVGGKFTSARMEAEKINDRVHKILEKPGRVIHPTREKPFPWTPSAANWQKNMTDEGIRAGLDPQTAMQCSFRYGNLFPELLKIVKRPGNLNTRVDPGYPFCLGEIAYAMEREMARNLKDVLFRRVPLKRITKMERGVVEKCVHVAAEVSGWSRERMEFEVSSILQDGSS